MADQTLYLRATTTKLDFYTDPSGREPGNANFEDVEEDTKFHFKRCQDETFQFQQIAFRALDPGKPHPISVVQSTNLQNYVAGGTDYPNLPKTATGGKCPVYNSGDWTLSDRRDFVLKTCSASEICVEDTHT